MRTVVIATVVLGCGGGTSARDLCKRIDSLCAAGFTDEDIEECSTDIPKLEGPMGTGNYDKLLACGNSNSCAELAGCASGAIASAGVNAIEDFERGFGRTFKGRTGQRDSTTPLDSLAGQKDTRIDETTRSRRAGGPLRRGEPLPAACKRFDAVCDEDRNPIERSECLERVDELRGDRARLARLTACYEAATTCAGFERCSTEMWFDLQRDSH